MFSNRYKTSKIKIKEAKYEMKEKELERLTNLKQIEKVKPFLKYL